MRDFFSQRCPYLRRVLLVESGERELFNELIPPLYEHPDRPERIDLVTCYDGLPRGYREDMGKVYRIHHYRGRQQTTALLRELRANRYTAQGIICSGQPILNRWKWLISTALPTKLFILNENCDYFWFDYTNWSTIRHFILFRAGMVGAGAFTTPLRALMAPFTLLFLALWAAQIHLRRALRLRYSPKGSTS
jgi:hypothetical protein